MVDQTEMREIPYTPTEFIRSPSQRNHNRLSRTLSAVRQTNRRPTSSIYSRSVTIHDDQQAIIHNSPSQYHRRPDEDENSHEKDPSRLDGWIHPAMRPEQQSTSTVTSISGMLKAIPSSRDDVSGDTGHDEAGPVRIEAAQPSVSTRKRRCGFVKVGFGILALITVIILIMCICVAMGVFDRNNGSSAEEDESIDTTSKSDAMLSTSVAIITAQPPTSVSSSMALSPSISGMEKSASSTISSTAPLSSTTKLDEENPLKGLVPDLQFGHANGGSS